MILHVLAGALLLVIGAAAGAWLVVAAALYVLHTWFGVAMTQLELVVTVLTWPTRILRSA